MNRAIRLFSIAAAGLLAACGSKSTALPLSDAGPSGCMDQVPIAGVAKPAKVMLVLDRSGSMKTLASSDTAWGCSNDANGNGYDPSGDCKWNSLKDLVTGSGGFLDRTANQARVGLAIFSDPLSTDACAGGVVLVSVPASPGASAGQIANTLAGITPNGGTPTAATLRAVAADTTFTLEESSTKRYVVLVTDGQPNCNSGLTTCSACTNSTGAPAQNCGDVRNCLDDVALVDAVKALKAKGIDTFVIGFGSAFENPAARATLDAAAVAGGMAQAGAATQFYLASDEAQLQAIFGRVQVVLQACTFALAHPPESSSDLIVKVSNQKSGTEATLVRGADWEFGDASRTTVVLLGTWCQKLQQAEADTYVVKFQRLDCAE